MGLFQRRVRLWSARRVWMSLCVSAFIWLGAAGCGLVAQTSTPSPVPPTEVEVVEPTGEPTPEPEENVAAEPEVTPTYTYSTVTALRGSVEDTAEGTFELYLRDAISQLERLQREKLVLRAHYESRAVTEQDMGGLIIAVDLLEDRTLFQQASPNTVVADADFDVVVTYANHDTRVFRCSWTVNLEWVRGKWYVLGPSELPLFQVCVS